MTVEIDIEGLEMAVSGLAVTVGTPMDLAEAFAKVDEDGVPTEMVIFPYPSYTNDDGTFVTDDLSQKTIVATFEKRAVKLAIDYEHQTHVYPPIESPAAGMAATLEAGGKRGLIAKDITWTRRARRYLASAGEGDVAEYNYHSPVYLYEPKTRRVVRLLSVGLTNVPKSHNQKELRDQIAARVRAELAAAAEENINTQKEEDMPQVKQGMAAIGKELISSLRYALGMRLTDSFNDLRNALAKLLKKIPESDDMLAEARAAEGGEEKAAIETLLEALGLVPAEEVEARVEARLAERPLLAPELAKVLGLEPGADLATVTARVLVLANPADMVPRSEHEAVLARIAELDETAKSSRIDELVRANAARLTPALEGTIRELAASNYELAKSTVEKLPEQKPEPIARGTEPTTETAEARIETEGELAGQPVRFDEEGAKIKARVEQIMAEKGLSYMEANEIRKKEARRA